ncbi:MAG TPA: response regulator [Casimicrobiaceae bacterium]|nr:response regulator [Casimicrobiaceae bacterium]
MARAALEQCEMAPHRELRLRHVRKQLAGFARIVTAREQPLDARPLFPETLLAVGDVATGALGCVAVRRAGSRLCVACARAGSVEHAHRIEQRIDPDRLRKQAVEDDPCPVPVKALVRITACAADDGHRVAVHVPKAMGDVDSVEPRHAHVDDGNVRRLARRHEQRGPSVANGPYPMAVEFQRQGECVDDLGVVVDQQDVCHERSLESISRSNSGCWRFGQRCSDTFPAAPPGFCPTRNREEGPLCAGRRSVTFVVRVVVGRKTEALPALADREIPSLRGMVLLVVDDDGRSLDLTARFIEDSFRCSVLTASSVDDALSILEAGAHVDLVFSDVCMPGKDGLALAESIGERFPTLPLILATGRPDVLPAIADRGAVALIKPYTLDRLAAVFVEKLRLPSPI